MKYTRVHYKYRLAETYQQQLALPGYAIDTPFISLTPSGELALREGYAWNGADGPTWDTANTMTPSLVHDCGYQLMDLGLLPVSLKPFWDDLFYAMLLGRGMWTVRARAWHRGVQKGGRPGGALPTVYVVE